MDYEKKYNELVGKIEKAYLYAQTDSTKAVLEDILPELAESEDERIRKALIRFHLSTIDIDGIQGKKIIAWLEKQAEKKEINPTLQEKERMDDAFTKMMLKPQVDSFDAELNALLKKYEHLSKKELQEPLEFYLGVVRDDLDIVREEKPKWTDEDEELLQHCCGAVAAADYYTLEDKEEMGNWLKSLKKRMEE